MTNNLNMFIPITKINAERREVWGWGAIEEPDNSDEILDYMSSKPLFMDWSNKAQKRSGGKSFGNVRSMHQNVAAGKLIALKADDVNKGFYVGAKIVDDNEWKKVEQGVYTGFSIGGSYAKRWSDFQNPGKIRYTAKPAELSIVDSPCIPSATFQMVKADGVTVTRSFKPTLGTNLISVVRDNMIKVVGGGALAKAGWEENKHPRDDDGKFGSGGGGGGGSKKEPRERTNRSIGLYPREQKAIAERKAKMKEYNADDFAAHQAKQKAASEENDVQRDVDAWKERRAKSGNPVKESEYGSTTRTSSVAGYDAGQPSRAEEAEYRRKENAHQRGWDKEPEARPWDKPKAPIDANRDKVTRQLAGQLENEKDPVKRKSIEEALGHVSNDKTWYGESGKPKAPAERGVTFEQLKREHDRGEINDKPKSFAQLKAKHDEGEAKGKSFDQLKAEHDRGEKKAPPELSFKDRVARMQSNGEKFPTSAKEAHEQDIRAQLEGERENKPKPKPASKKPDIPDMMSYYRQPTDKELAAHAKAGEGRDMTGYHHVVDPNTGADGWDLDEPNKVTKGDVMVKLNRLYDLLEKAEEELVAEGELPSLRGDSPEAETDEFPVEEIPEELPEEEADKADELPVPDDDGTLDEGEGELNDSEDQPVDEEDAYEPTPEQEVVKVIRKTIIDLADILETSERRLVKQDVPGAPESIADIPLAGKIGPAYNVEQMPPPNVLLEIKPNAEPSQDILANHAVMSKDLTAAFNAWLPKVGVLVKSMVASAVAEALDDLGKTANSAPVQISSAKNARIIKVRKEQ